MQIRRFIYSALLLFEGSAITPWYKSTTPLELNAKYAKSKEYREYVQKYNSMYRLVNLDALQKKDQEYKKNNIDACKSRDRLRYNMNKNSINEKRRT
jgi:hypothetical protein